MIHVKRLPLQSDTNFFAINGIVIPMAFYYMEVTMHTRDKGDRELKLAVRMNPNVAREAYHRGVDYRTYIPVLACRPSSDDEFYTELGYVDVNSRYFDMRHQKRSHLAYMGMLPDVAASDVRDKRYVCPLDVYQVPPRPGMPMHFRRTIVHGATICTDYLRTSAIDKIDDDMWTALCSVDQPKGISWSRFLDEATSGRFTPHDDLSNYLESLDQEYMPEHIFKQLRQVHFEKRMRG